MNKDRRQRLEKIKEGLEEVRTKLEELKSDVEEIKDEEQDAYDNLPESLQESERGCNMQDNIDTLESIDNIDFDSSIDEMIDYIDECIDR